MKLFISYIFIFMASCVVAQSVQDELVMNDADFATQNPKFSLVGATTEFESPKIDRKDELRAFHNSDSGSCLHEADKRNTKNIRVLKEGSLEKLLALEPISYLMKNRANEDRSIGLVAQDVRKIFPALVHYVDGEDVLAISYIELIPIMIKAIQEQQSTIQNLKENQYTMQKELAVFQLQMVQLTERLAKKEINTQNDIALVAQNHK